MGGGSQVEKKRKAEGKDTLSNTSNPRTRKITLGRHLQNYFGTDTGEWRVMV